MATNYNRLWRTLSAFTLVVLASSVLVAQKRSVPVAAGEFKNLAGPVEEIEAMRLPAPSELGARSRSASFPIDGASGTQEFEIPVDSSDNFRVMLLSPNAGELTISAAVGSGEFRDLRAAGLAGNVRRVESSYGLDGNRFPAEVFVFDGFKGPTVRVRVDKPKGFSASGRTIGYLVASSDSPYRVYSYVDSLRTTVGREIAVVSEFFNAKENGEDGRPETLIAGVRMARMVVTSPNGEIIETQLSPAGDEFRGAFVPTSAGRYSVQIFSNGETPEGAEFVRSSELSVDVAPEALTVRGGMQVSRVDELRSRLAIPVAGTSAGRTFIVHAEVWARSTNGDEFPVSWVGGLSRVESGRGRNLSLPVTLDSRWLAQAPDAKSFWLKNVRIQNPDSSVVVGEIDELSMPAIEVPSLARSFYGVVTDEMREGVKPASVVENAIGGKLMLVHGYCSGDAWGPAASAGQFTNYVKFLDLNKNRSHDQFAQLIKNFGASLPSFGIVAHSQGGAASLHLYTYYWSGLDSATGTRLIQSVGTPYQGTALAGNLAILGQIFGAGCGSNTDLTYSGAASWLANIPTWARAKVYYHTTSFTDVWYRYDYCNIATDPFLSDPDDGVVERAYAQLSGANNLGHKTGWCHTTGMRDPSQTGDSSRNANMNVNAAR